MEIFFQSISETFPDEKWRQVYERYWPAYSRWFMKEGDGARPTYLSCERALWKYMPELMATYQRLLELSGGGDQVARFLNLYRPTNYMSGCSQAVWTRDQPFLIRNYDYSSNLWEGKLWRTCWNGKRVIAMSDCLWGVLDGMNESGLATNHQDRIDWPEHAHATASLDRAHVLSLRLQDENETRERFVSRFLEPPLYQTKHDQGWGTLYTAMYDPLAKKLSCCWPGYQTDYGFDSFIEQSLVIRSRFGIDQDLYQGRAE